MGFSLDPSNWGQDLGDAVSFVAVGGAALPFETLAYAGTGIAAPFDGGSSFNWLNQYNAALLSNPGGALAAAGGILSGNPNQAFQYLGGGVNAVNAANQPKAITPGTSPTLFLLLGAAAIGIVLVILWVVL